MDRQVKVMMGYEVAFRINDDAAMTFLGTNCTISISSDYLYTSSKESKYNDVIPNGYTYTLSFDGYNDPSLSQATSILGKQLNGSKVTWVAYKQVLDSDGNAIDDISDKFLSGKAIIKSSTFSWGVTSVSTYSANMEGIGIINEAGRSSGSIERI